MVLNHVGIVNKSEEEALRFYRDFLGLNVAKQWVVPAELTEQLFAVSRDTVMIVFEGDAIKIEVFISPDYVTPAPEYRHIGLFVDDLSAIADKAGGTGVEFITGRTKDKTVYFIKDFAGNLIEIKER